MAITSFYDLLEVGRDASKEQIDASYATRQQYFLKIYGSDPVKLALVLSLLKDAYETLVVPVKRLEHDRALDAQMAEKIEQLQDRPDDRNSRVSSCYYLLGIDRGRASREQIDQGYKTSEERVRRMFGGEPIKLEKALKVLSYAYETLTDQVRKLEHDKILDAQVAEILNENKKNAEVNASLRAAEKSAEAAANAAKVAAQAAEQISAAQNKVAHDAVEKYKLEVARRKQRNIWILILILVLSAIAYSFFEQDKSKSNTPRKSISSKEPTQKKQTASMQPKSNPAEMSKPITSKSAVSKDKKSDPSIAIAAESARQNEEAKRICDRVYGQDAMVQDQIEKTRNLFENQIQALKDQRTSAILGGAANHSNFGLMVQSMNRAGQPYTDRINQLVAERDGKISQFQYEQKKLRYDYTQCYP